MSTNEARTMSEPALTREEIEQVALSFGFRYGDKTGPDERRDYRAQQSFKLASEVEHLTRQRVEERMKELVCEECGKEQGNHFGDDPCGEWLTRAEFESRKERERER